jgi:hypothetical protein
LKDASEEEKNIIDFLCLSISHVEEWKEMVPIGCVFMIWDGDLAFERSRIGTAFTRISARNEQTTVIWKVAWMASQLSAET